MGERPFLPQKPPVPAKPAGVVLVRPKDRPPDPPPRPPSLIGSNMVPLADYRLSTGSVDVDRVGAEEDDVDEELQAIAANSRSSSEHGSRSPTPEPGLRFETRKCGLSSILFKY